MCKKKFENIIKDKPTKIISSAEALKNIEPFDWQFENHKPGNVKQSLERGFREIKEHKEKKRQLKSLEECEKEWEGWIKDESKRYKREE